MLEEAIIRFSLSTESPCSILEIDLGVYEDLEQGSQASSCVEARNSACLSRCSWGVRPLVELDLAPAAFSGGYNQAVSAPSCCDLILDVTFEDVSGNLDLP